MSGYLLDTCPTMRALGYDDPWQQLAIRWPLYVVAGRRKDTRRDWRKGRTSTTQPVASALTSQQRREATRRAALGHGAREIARKLGAPWQTVRHYLAARRAA